MNTPKKHSWPTLALVALLAFAALSATPPTNDVKADVSGNWLFSVETSVGSGSPTFTFQQAGEKLTGQYKGQLGEAPVTGTVKGNEIAFSFTVNAQGSDVVMNYSGTVEGETMKGKLDASGLATGTWSAKRPPKGK
ncbi:MAG: hypothetical protein H7Z75_21225 [Ferruginibacter sp.]|nr:hypothetical protein [Cytophagales bacterium]